MKAQAPSSALASEVSLFLLVPTSKHKTQIKCAKNRLRYLLCLGVVGVAFTDALFGAPA